MKAKMIAGNWKMNHGSWASSEFVNKLEEWLDHDFTGQGVAKAARDCKIEIVIAPTFTSLAYAVSARKSNMIEIAAQNAHYESKGAFTGEVSLEMLKEIGCKYVILGHSERRHVFGETDDLLTKKLHATLKSTLLPIFCVGEQLVERETGNMEAVLEKQLASCFETLNGPDMAEKVVIAYEPVWAIGTGKTASNEDAQRACKFIRSLVEKKFGAHISPEIRILYGGSVKPENSAGLLAQPDVDGLLIGGASLELDSYEKILQAACLG